MPAIGSVPDPSATPAAKTSIIGTPRSEGLEETCGFFLRLTRKVRTAADLFERQRYGVFRSCPTLASAPTLLTDGIGSVRRERAAR